MRDLTGSRDERDSALERALLRAGASYKSSASARARTLAALGVAGSATLLAGAAQSAILPSFAKLTSSIVLAVSVVGAAAVPLGYYTWQRHQAATHGRSAVRVVALARSTDRPAQELPVPAIVAAVAPAAIAPAAIAPAAVAMRMRPTAARPSGAAAGPNSTLAHELASIDGALASLAQGDATGALAQLDSYQRSYRRGYLQPEAEVLRIDALSASGQRGAARDRADAFLSRNPHSVFAAHVHSRLDN